MPRRVPALNRSSEPAGSGWSAVISIRPGRRRLKDREGSSTSRSPRLNRQDGLSLSSRPLQPLLRLRTQPLAGQRPPGQHWVEGLCRSLSLVLAFVLALPALPALASPGLCVGPVCGDEFSRSALYHWQLRLRVNDQQGHRERLVVDCRTGALSPQQGLVERGYASAVARRACRLAAEGMAGAIP